MKNYHGILVGFVLVVVLIAAGCSSGTATTSTPPTSTTPTTSITTTTTSTPPTTTTTQPPTTTTTTQPPTTTTTTSAGTTFQALATEGAGVYSSSCAVCHGASGGGGVGPALWGSGATLGTYLGSTLYAKNAQAMLDFTSAQMPLSAPGSLSSDQYTQVICYILVQNNFVSASTTFDASTLSNITWS